MKALCILSGISLVLLGLVVGGVTMISSIDPVSRKMADDSDPFGPSPSRFSLLAMMGGSAAVGLAGVYLVSLVFWQRPVKCTFRSGAGLLL